MNVFLASKAVNALEKITTYLPKSPSEMSVAFIPNAADIYDQKPWQDEDREKLVALGFQVEDLDLREIQAEKLKDKLENVDIIFVAGGNTSYLLEKAQESNFLQITKKLVNSGKVYIGSSAGSLLAAKNIELDKIFDDGKFGKELASYDALGLIDFVPLPHANNDRYAPYHKKVFEQYGDKYEFKKICDNEFITITNSSVKTISTP